MEAALARILEQVREVQERIKAHDPHIAQLREESVALKAESDALREETRAILASLSAYVMGGRRVGRAKS